MSSMSSRPKSRKAARTAAYQPRFPPSRLNRSKCTVACRVLLYLHSTFQQTTNPLRPQTQPAPDSETQHHGPPSHSHSLPPQLQTDASTRTCKVCAIQLDPEQESLLHRYRLE